MLSLLAPLAAEAPAVAEDIPLPTKLYRWDTRAPEEIFAAGFRARGDDSSLILHVVDRVGRRESSSAYVATTSDVEAANLLPRQREGGWIYEIWADDRFYSVNQSLRNLADDIGMAFMPPEAQENLGRLREHVGWADEWVAAGDIPAGNVIRATPRTVGHPVDWEGASVNAAAKSPSTLPTGRPLRVNPADTRYIPPPRCAAPLARAVSCVDVEPATGEELASLHRDTLTEADDIEVYFADDVADLSLADDVLLSPLTETRAVLDEFAGSGAADLEKLTADVSASLSRDLSLLDRISAHSPTLGKVLATAGKGAKVVGKAIPYLAIAATGYALSEDIKTGNWVDAGFDGIAEGLMILEVIAPELSEVIMPALLVEMAIQLIVDHFRPVAPPSMTAPQRQQATEDLSRWRALPDELARLRLELSDEQLKSALEAWERDTLVPTLRARLSSDEAVLAALAANQRVAAQRAAVEAAGGVPRGPAFEAVKPARDAMIAMIDDAFETQRETRRQLLARGYADQLQEVADAFAAERAGGSAVTEELRTRFDASVTWPALDASEQRLSDWSGFQNPPLTYPSQGVPAYREKLKNDAFSTYNAEFDRLLAGAPTIRVPRDVEDSRSILVGSSEPGAQAPTAWGQAVPGGHSGDIDVTPAGAPSGLMSITAPEGSTLSAVKASSEGTPVTVAPDKRTATVGFADRAVTFGTGDGQTRVRVRVAAPPSAASGSTVAGGSVTIARGGAEVSRRKLHLTIQDTVRIPAAFAAPGASVEIEVPVTVPRGHRAEVRAPGATTFDRRAAGGGYTYSPDNRTVTISASDSPVDAPKVVVRVPIATAWATTMTGRVTVKDPTGVPTQTGDLTVTTSETSVIQLGRPSLPTLTTGSIGVRLTNHTSHSAAGLRVEVSAPRGTEFTSNRLVVAHGSGSTATLPATRSADRRTLTIDAKDFRLGPTSHADFTMSITSIDTVTGAIIGKCGEAAQGCFAVTGGGIVPGGAALPLSYTASIHTLKDARLSMGPNKIRSTSLISPPIGVRGTLSITAPGSANVLAVKVGAELRLFLADPRATVGPIDIPANTPITVTLYNPGGASPSTTHTGSVTIRDAGRLVASGELTLEVSTEGCISWSRQWVPAYGLFYWTYWTRVTNSCRADIDVRVHYLFGGPTGWKTIRPNQSATFEWWVPWAEPWSVETGKVTPR